MIVLGSPRYLFDSVESTMDTLSDLARAGAAEGTLVVAREQRAGRGRAGRKWSTPPGTALLCSVLLRPDLAPHQLGALPLVVGVAIAEAIETIISQPCQLKWPNDLFIEDRKACGILVQTRAIGTATDFVNVGIGINVATSRDELPETATSLSVASGRPIALDDVETQVMARLQDRYGAFLAAHGEPSLAGWERRARFLGEIVAVENLGRIERGRFVGVTPQGALRLETESGVRAIVAGDLTRGPQIDA